MENSNNKTKEQLEDNNVKHPAPSADPGADIETVIPSTEDVEDDSAGKIKEEPEVAQDENEAEAEASEESPEMPAADGAQSSTDEHGVETVSP